MSKLGWLILTHFYSNSIEYKATKKAGKEDSNSNEENVEEIELDPFLDNYDSCIFCVSESLFEKESEELKRKRILDERKSLLLASELLPMFYRKTGSPTEVIPARLLRGDDDQAIEQEPPITPPVALSAIEQDLRQGQLLQGEILYRNPLPPGIYCLINRKWLKQWRNYFKLVEAEIPPPIDSSLSLLLCFEHGLFCLPFHLEKYLEGRRRNLLSLVSDAEREDIRMRSDFNGKEEEEIEIVTLEEWEMLLETLYNSQIYDQNSKVNTVISKDLLKVKYN